jgi:cell wall-associated NlpC family hydrolase
VRRTKTVRRTAARVTVCSAAVTLAMVCTVTAGATSPPVNPTNGQLSQAAEAKSALASKVGDLQSEVSNAQTQLQLLAGNAELAEQNYALAAGQLQQASTAAAAAQAAVVTAQHNVATARVNLREFVQSSYIQPTATSGVGNLLTAPDPNSLLQSGDYIRYVAQGNVDAVAALDRATLAQSNAVAQAQTLVVREQSLANAAAQAQATAAQALQAQTTQTATLTASLNSDQTQLATAQQQLATLTGQRATYDAYVIKQAAIAKALAAKRAAALAEQRRLAAAEAARQLVLRQQAAAAELLVQQQQQAAAAAAASAASSNASGSAPAGSSSGSSSSNSSTVVSVPDPTPLPSAAPSGSWTLAKGQAAVARALTQVGVQYAWDGGNYNGPTFGVNYPGTDGWNDSTHFGFDCSGLTMYAWAPQGLFMTHYAATQYSQAGSVHPAAGQFEPGDLLFWSTNGTVGGIHHVAMYIGNGDVVQAPDSNDVVKITPWDQVDGGYFGATRPLT